MTWHAQRGAGDARPVLVSRRWSWQSGITAFLSGCFLLSTGLATWAGLERTQTISLQAGWNAVWLDVYPAESDPAAVFAGLPVDSVATHYPAPFAGQFVADPGTDLYTEKGWMVWYSPDRRDAFLTTLFGIYGQQAYLIHATEDAIWNVTGNVSQSDVKWRADAFNFVGFAVHPTAAPTFAQFFQPSAAHAHNRIYRLVNGAWRQVLEPEAETMRPHEAFWIFCDGPSVYEGPLQVETPLRQGLILAGTVESLVLRNRADHPITPTVEHYDPDEASVPLSVVIKVFSDGEQPDRFAAVPKPSREWVQALPPLEAQATIAVPLEARLDEMDLVTHTSLLRITTDLGTESWIPVLSVREDLETP